MKLPLDRERRRERNLLDDIDELELAAAQTPEERLVDALDLSDLALDLYLANPDAPVIDRLEDRQEKARGHRLLRQAPLDSGRRGDRRSQGVLGSRPRS